MRKYEFHELPENIQERLIDTQMSKVDVGAYDEEVNRLLIAEIEKLKGEKKGTYNEARAYFTHNIKAGEFNLLDVVMTTNVVDVGTVRGIMLEDGEKKHLEVLAYDYLSEKELDREQAIQEIVEERNLYNRNGTISGTKD